MMAIITFETNGKGRTEETDYLITYGTARAVIANREKEGKKKGNVAVQIAGRKALLLAHRNPSRRKGKKTT